MPILSPPNSPPNTEAGDSLYKIGKEWCMGDTVKVFNNNFVNIDSRIDGLSSNLYSGLSAYVSSYNVVDSTTIDLTYSTALNRLSGEVINGSINTTKLGGDILQAGKALLTAVSLSALRDIRITNLADNNVLTWSSVSGVWINLPSQGGGGGVGVTVGDKGDISVTEFNNQQSWTIDTGAVTETKIADNAVSPAKLSLGGPRWIGSGNVGIAGAANASVALTVYGNISASGTVFGNIGTISSAARALDIDGGAKGQLLCQIGSGDTDFTTVGSSGQLLQSVGGTGDGKPVWVSQNTLTVKDALSAGYTARLNVIDTNLLNPTVNRLIYQRRSNETVFIPTGSIGQVLTLVDDPDSNQSPTILFPRPAWSNPSDITVGIATRAFNLSGSAVYGSIPYQTAAGSTLFTSGGVDGQILKSGGSSSAPSWISQSTIVAGKADAIKSSTVNGVLYQSAADTTSTVSVQPIVLPDSTPYILTHNGGSGTADAARPKWQSAASLTIGTATAAASAAFAASLRIPTRGIVWHDYTAPSTHTTKVTQFGNQNQILALGVPQGGGAVEPTWISATQLGQVNASTITGNVSGGVARNILVQTGNSVTGFIDAPIPTDNDGYVLTFKNNTDGFGWTPGGPSTTSNLQVRAIGANIANTEAGTIKAQLDIVAFASDKRLKENITPISNALNKVNSISGFTYNFNDLAATYGFDKNIKYTGVFAQDIERVLPEAVRTAPFDPGTGENYLTVQYEKIVPLLIEAIKELSQEVEVLKSKIKE